MKTERIKCEICANKWRDRERIPWAHASTPWGFMCRDCLDTEQREPIQLNNVRCDDCGYPHAGHHSETKNLCILCRRNYGSVGYPGWKGTPCVDGWERADYDKWYEENPHWSKHPEIKLLNQS